MRESLKSLAIIQEQGYLCLVDEDMLGFQVKLLDMGYTLEWNIVHSLESWKFARENYESCEWTIECLYYN